MYIFRNSSSTKMLQNIWSMLTALLSLPFCVIFFSLFHQTADGKKQELLIDQSLFFFVNTELAVASILRPIRQSSGTFLTEMITVDCTDAEVR